MLDVHAPHEAVHPWRDFFIHIATKSPICPASHRVTGSCSDAQPSPNTKR